MNSPTDRCFDSAGVPIRYVELGSGAPVVLVHSFMGHFDADFVRSGVVAALANEFRVIGIDLRGHGKSGKPHDPQQYGREMALDIARLLDHLGLARAHLVGYSLGAHVVAQLLALRPERVESAVLAGSCGRRQWSAEDDQRVEVEAHELEQGLLRTQLSRLQRPDGPPLSDATVNKLSALLLAGNDNAALAAVRRSNRDQVIDDAQLAAARAPMLGIVGGDDPYIASFHALSASVPQFRFVVIDGATHNQLIAHPEFLRVVHSFLREHVARGNGP